MSATALSLAALLALANDARCGGAGPGTEFSQRLAAIALHESGGDPLVIGVNADADRDLPAAVVRSATAAEAADRARAQPAHRLDELLPWNWKLKPDAAIFRAA